MGNMLRILDLQDQTPVCFRHAHRDNDAGDGPEWSEWKAGTLTITCRRNTSNPRKVSPRLAPYAAKNAPLSIVVEENPDGVEFSMNDVCNDEQGCEIIAEQYRVQIQDIHL